MIKEITNSSSTIKMLPATKDDPRKRKPDITVAGRELGWKPQVKNCYHVGVVCVLVIVLSRPLAS